MLEQVQVIAQHEEMHRVPVFGQCQPGLFGLQFVELDAARDGSSGINHLRHFEGEIVSPVWYGSFDAAT